MDTYLEIALKRLRDAFSSSPQFSIDEAVEALRTKKSSMRWTLSNLTNSGEIIRVGKGLYTLDKRSLSFRAPRLSPEMKSAVESLRNEGISFVLTGLDILLPFVQHQPSRLLHLLYAAIGAGTWTQSQLKTTRFIPMLGPSRREIESMLDINEAAELIIIRERSSELGSSNSLATLERAFIDLYYEASREQIPFALQEVGYIFLNMRKATHLNTSQMLRYAHARSIRDEIQNVLKSADDPRRDPTSDRSAQFLKILRTIR